MSYVALRKESVDRNNFDFMISSILSRSLSARRAWIEMSGHRQAHTSPRVALRKESVDRNVILPAVPLSSILSLSARRAWIEISVGSAF